MSQSEVQGHTQVSSKFDLNVSVLEGFYEVLEEPFYCVFTRRTHVMICHSSFSKKVPSVNLFSPSLPPFQSPWGGCSEQSWQVVTQMPRQRLAYQDTLLPFFGSHFLCSFVPGNFYFLLEIIRGTAILISASLKTGVLKSQVGGEIKRVKLWGMLREERGIALHWNRTVNEPSFPGDLRWHWGS